MIMSMVLLQNEKSDYYGRGVSKMTENQALSLKKLLFIPSET